MDHSGCKIGLNNFLKCGDWSFMQKIFDFELRICTDEKMRHRFRYSGIKYLLLQMTFQKMELSKN